MRQDNGRGHTGMPRSMQAGHSGEGPTVRVARGGEGGAYRRAPTDQGHGGGGLGSGEYRARMRRSVQRGWRRLGFRRHFLMLLVTATLLSTLGTVAAAYLGARVAAISNAQSRIRRDLTVADQVLQAHGPNLGVQNGELFTADGTRLNSDATVINQMVALTGDETALYQLESGRLMDIAGNVNSDQDGVGIGQPLAGPAAQMLLNSCVRTQKTPCTATYSGVITMAGTSYIAGLAPLNDDQGHLVGALGVVTPLAAIDTPLRQLAGLLLLIGLLLTGIFIVVGYRISGPVSRGAVNRLSQGLDDVSMAAGELEKMARRQMARSEHQVAAAQDIVAELRKLSDLAEALEHGTNLLRESTGQLWAEMSYPAPEAPRSLAAPGSSPAMRQTAVAASQIGAAAGQARVLCHGLRTRLNQIIAEAGLLSDERQDVDAYVESLTSAVQRAECALDSHPASTGQPTWLRGFTRMLRGRPASAAGGPSRGDDLDDGALEASLTDATQGMRTEGGSFAWQGRGAMNGNGRGTHSARPRSGHTSPRLNARNPGPLHSMPHPAITSGPPGSGSHPSMSGRRQVPWYSDEQDLTGPFGEKDVTGYRDGRTNPPMPPSQQSGSWRLPPAERRSGPPSGNWMNDAR